MIGLRGEPSGSPRFAFRGPHTDINISGSQDLGVEEASLGRHASSNFCTLPHTGHAVLQLLGVLAHWVQGNLRRMGGAGRCRFLEHSPARALYFF